MSTDAVPAGVDSTLTVDLDAIADNYRYLCEQAPTAEVAAVVKADAYGLGLERVAPVLAAAGCATFFVATVQEGIALRAVLTNQRIAVLNGCADNAGELCRQHRLAPVLNSLQQLGDWRQHAARSDTAALLHVDTGMSRLGLSPDDVIRLRNTPQLLDGVRISHIMSHLACAEEPDNPLNERQRTTFVQLRDALAPLLGDAKGSLANSSAIFLGPEFHFDMVRPGAALYGLAPTVGKPNPMHQTIELHGRILQLREIDESKTVGYGATHRAERASRIATVAVGYADGYSRAFSNCGRAFVGSTQVPVVGRVSMDLTTLDVTAIPPDRVQPGTLVELIGQHIRTDEAATVAGTIGYEILTRLGHRYHRVYRASTA